jgi:hypothetical protein
MSAVILLFADGLVAVLLVATIVSSLALSKRITRLKADEATMRQTIGELMVAADTAERAIAGLRTTLGDCDRTLADRLRLAERYAADLADQVEAGESVMTRISQIVDATRQIATLQPTTKAPVASAAPPVEQTSPNVARMKAAAEAAAALSERALKRLEGHAA